MLGEVTGVNKIPRMLDDMVENSLPSHESASPSAPLSTRHCSSCSCHSDSGRAHGRREGSATRVCATASWETPWRHGTAAARRVCTRHLLSSMCSPKCAQNGKFACQEAWTNIFQRVTEPSKREARSLSLRPAGSHPRCGLCAGEEHKEGLEHGPRIVVHVWSRPGTWGDVRITNRAPAQPASR